jgi:hypothetical protein
MWYMTLREFQLNDFTAKGLNERTTFGNQFRVRCFAGLEASDLAPLEVDVAPLQRHDLADSQSTFTAQQGDHSRICCMMP